MLSQEAFYIVQAALASHQQYLHGPKRSSLENQPPILRKYPACLARARSSVQNYERLFAHQLSAMQNLKGFARKAWAGTPLPTCRATAIISGSGPGMMAIATGKYLGGIVALKFGLYQRLT